MFILIFYVLCAKYITYIYIHTHTYIILHLNYHGLVSMTLPCPNPVIDRVILFKHKPHQGTPAQSLLMASHLLQNKIPNPDCLWRHGSGRAGPWLPHGPHLRPLSPSLSSSCSSPCAPDNTPTAFLSRPLQLFFALSGRHSLRPQFPWVSAQTLPSMVLLDQPLYASTATSSFSSPTVLTFYLFHCIYHHLTSDVYYLFLTLGHKLHQRWMFILFSTMPQDLDSALSTQVLTNIS